MASRFLLSIGLALSALALAACGSIRSFDPASHGQSGLAGRALQPKALQQNNGAQFVEFKTKCAVPLGQLSHGTISESMWFTIPAGCKKNAPGLVGKIDLQTGQVTEYALGKVASPLAIAENASYVWVADQAKTKTGTRSLYRFNEDGTSTSFLLPNAIEVNSLAAGPDGNLWFCGTYVQNKQTLAAFGYVTPSGTSTFYPLAGTPTPVLTSITSGSDGNLWMTDENGSIDRIAPSTGAVTTFAVGGHPLYLTSSSNVIVYSDSTAGQLSTITKTGQFAVYPAPSGEHPGFLARKTDGSVLFVDTANNSQNIGTFTPSTDTYGAEAQAPNVGLRYLYNGNDGNMWFTDSYGDVGAYLKFVLTTTPASLAISSPSCSGTFTPAEPNYSGSFSVTSLNSGVATVSPSSGPAGTVFTVAGASDGTTAISVTDKMYNATTVPVTVSGTCIADTLVYVSDNTQVLIFDSVLNSEVGSISQGIGGPTGMDVDGAGNLYVANSDAEDGVQFLPGQNSPALTYQNPGTHPWDITLCPDGTVYIAPLAAQSVAIYAGGATSPTGSIQNPDSAGNFAVHCDPSSNVYVLYQSSQYGTARVREYPPGGGGSGTLLGMSGGYRSSLTIDSAGDVVFANDTTNGIEFWKAGGSKPFKTLTTFEGVGTLQYVKFGIGEQLLWVQVSQGGGTYAYSINPSSGAIVEQLPYVSAGGPGLAVYPADVFGQKSRPNIRPGWRERAHWDPPTDSRPQPAATSFRP